MIPIAQASPHIKECCSVRARGYDCGVTSRRATEQQSHRAPSLVPRRDSRASLQTGITVSCTNGFLPHLKQLLNHSPKLCSSIVSQALAVSLKGLHEVTEPELSAALSLARLGTGFSKDLHLHMALHTGWAAWSFSFSSVQLRNAFP